MSEGMNPWLAQVYNTHGAAEVAAEEQQKIAHGQLFAKLAADHGIDLSTMSNEDIERLHNRVFAKTAEPEPPKEEKKEEAKEEKKEEKEDEKKAAAKKAEEYHSEKVAMEEKLAEADLMGRVMAHAFTQELELIKRAAEEKKDEKPEDKSEKKDEKPEEKKDDGEKKLPPWLEKKKEGSAEQFESLAVRRAVEIAKEANFDADVAEKRVSAVATLGLRESEKIAHVRETEAAIHVRGLEYLEAAGYPVDWEQVFGKK